MECLPFGSWHITVKCVDVNYNTRRPLLETMVVAYILEQNTSIRLEGERLLVQRKKDTLRTLHIYKLKQLVLFGNISLTPAVITRLFRENIDTVFMSRAGRYMGRLQGQFSKNITLRHEQFARMMDAGYAVETARAIVAGKLANMRSVLMRIKRSRDEAALGKQVAGIKKIMGKVRQATDLDSLRGYEGSASAMYFEGFARGLLGNEVGFEKRVRRPPTDPVNALLSLGYTLLLNSVMNAVCMVGFDPYLGTLHAVEYGRPSLVLDLMEEWRPLVVDTLVLSVFNLKTLTLSDFKKGVDVDESEETRENGDSLDEKSAVTDELSREPALPVRLTDDGFRKFIVQFERKMNQKIRHRLTGQQLSYRDCIREQVRHFARVVRGEEKAYRPMVMR
ncbi:MAG: CRISPR-associated endonuclease Cas1 [Deltaproteobacteria bacterium]|nr:MAG: CRISPR-associated endonuclease Cas1 [Deltaproteobacteria bacterium]